MIARKTYQFVNVPTSMLASRLCFSHTLMNLEVPIHVGSFHFLAFFVCLEATTTLSARGTQPLIKAGDEMGSFPTSISSKSF